MVRPFSLVVLVLLAHLPLRAGQIRLSFLNDSAARRDTENLLLRSGGDAEACRVFGALVERYYASGFEFDTRKFPKAERGFYSFATAGDLVSAQPHRLSDTVHTWDINCVDAVVLLLRGQLSTVLRPDDLVGPFIVSTATTNGEQVTMVATARDAFTRAYADWYREATETVFPQSMRDARVCLSAQLFQWHLLPLSTEEQKEAEDALSVLRADWQRQKLGFPPRCKVVLLHKVALSARTVCTCHAGLLIERPGGYTYIEKAGGSGPFVRLDIGERADLLPWLSAKFDEREREAVSLYATFNDETMEKLTGFQPQHAADGSQPFSSVPSRAPEAAGSRR